MAQRRALVIRHTPWEGIAAVGPPIEAAGYRLEPVDVDDPSFATLDFDNFDLVIPLGGPMGVYQRERYPWIDGEIARLTRRIDAGAPTLGVCFGAQMVAAAMGVEVYRGPTKEVGFAPVALTPEGRASPLRHVDAVPILHWHGDSFALPDGTTLLASTTAYAQQAFARGDVLALQCHAEMGLDDSFEGWLDGSDNYLAKAGTDAATLRRDYAELGPACAAAGAGLISEWLDGLSRR
jgi:GMP synthase (glutamine-hydrolysing)